MKEPIATAFEVIMDAITRIQNLGEMPDAEFRRYMDAGRGLMPYISAERNGTLRIEEVL